MRDDDIRALFREVDDGPPVIFDAGEVIERGARIRVRRRRWAIAASAVSSAAVVIGWSGRRTRRSPASRCGPRAPEPAPTGPSADLPDRATQR